MLLLLLFFVVVAAAVCCVVVAVWCCYIVVVCCAPLVNVPLVLFAPGGMQGFGGGIHLPKHYVKQAFEITREHGGLCVSDEVSAC